MNEQKLECLCPFCEEVFDLNEATLYEDDTGTESAVCPICEERIPLDEIGDFLRAAGAAARTGMTAWRKMALQRQQMKIKGEKYRKAKMGMRLAHQRLKGKEIASREAGDVEAAEKYKSQRLSLRGKKQAQKQKHKERMELEKSRMGRVQRGIKTSAEQLPQAPHVIKSAEAPAAKKPSIWRRLKRKPKTEALSEAIRLYWDEGETMRNIQMYLAEDMGLLPEEIHRVTADLGIAIRKFDSDLDSKTVMSMLCG